MPSNIEFIAANNGMVGDPIDEVRKVVFEASYMVMGLGDVYLGAPCAVPVDPRHRMVVPKYNPARTYTPEGGGGIGGCYMCICGGLIPLISFPLHKKMQHVSSERQKNTNFFRPSLP